LNLLKKSVNFYQQVVNLKAAGIKKHSYIAQYRRSRAMKDKKTRVCPLERAEHLDTRWRRWIQNPRRVLFPYVKEGMRVLDFGCGPGFFTVELARLVGQGGHVIAADLQEGMLEKLKKKIEGSDLAGRIVLHRCSEKEIGLREPIDFALAYYVLHELPDQVAFFRELAAILQPGGEVLIVEPPFHVSRNGFARMIEKAGTAGFRIVEGPKGIFNKLVRLKKEAGAEPEGDKGE